MFIAKKKNLRNSEVQNKNNYKKKITIFFYKNRSRGPWGNNSCLKIAQNDRSAPLYKIMR